MTRFSAWACAALLLAGAAGSARAADTPMLRFQAQSLKELHAKAHEVYMLASGLGIFRMGFDEEAGAGATKPGTWGSILEDGVLDPKLLPGIDIKKPSFAYANLDAGVTAGDFSKCEAVFLLPASSEKDFLELLKKYEIGAKAGEGGLTRLLIPDAPFPVFLRFAKGYACISLFSEKPIDSRVLPDPATLLDAKQAAGLALDVQADRLPEAFKKDAREAVDYALTMWSKDADREGPLAQMMMRHFDSYARRMTETLLTQSKEVNLTFDADIKTGDGVLNVALDGKPGSELAKDIAAYKAPVNTFGGLAKMEATSISFHSMPLFSKEVRDLTTDLLDEATKVLKGDDAMPEGVEITRAALAALRKAVQSGKLDMVQVLGPPNKDNQYSALLAIRLEDAGTLNAPLAKLVKALPEEYQKFVKLDAAKIDGIGIHKLALADLIPQVPGPGQMILGAFGKDPTVHLALGEEAIYLAFGADAEKLIGEAIRTKPAVVGDLANTYTGKHIGQFIKTISGGQIPPEFVAGFEKIDTMNYLAIKTDGGAKFKLEGRSGMFAIGVAALRRERQFAPIAPVKPR